LRRPIQQLQANGTLLGPEFCTQWTSRGTLLSEPYQIRFSPRARIFVL
jgi:hypothetical protein